MAESLAERIARMPRLEQLEALRQIAPSPEDVKALEYNWSFWGRPEQQEPPGDWFVWAFVAGRGAGKTRTASEWVLKRKRQGARRIALVARTAADVRNVIVLGESGILATSPPWDRPKYEPTKSCLTWDNGCKAELYSADKPDALRGPQFDTAVTDELAAYRYPEAYAQLRLGVRSAQSGLTPRILVTTTPRATPLMKQILQDPTVHVTRGTTWDNKAHLAPTFIGDIKRLYGGTRLGRQELEGEMLLDNPGALFRIEWIEDHRDLNTDPEHLEHLQLDRIVIGVDPAVTTGDDADETGIVVAGVKDAHLGGGRYLRVGYIIEDASDKYTPDEWARVIVKLYRQYAANAVVVEVNNGGDLVKKNIHTVDASVYVKEVHATRGKAIRAEPVSALYEQGRIRHLGGFPKLEDQMCEWVPGVLVQSLDMGGGPKKKRKASPDRMDAMVWAIWDLMVEHAVRDTEGDNPDETEHERIEREALEDLLHDDFKDDDRAWF